MPFVPHDFEVPRELRTGQFRLEPLGVEHNGADHAAWTSSVAHIRRTPGFPNDGWPPATMSLEDNRADLAAHAADFTARSGFTYTVLTVPAEEVIGCVYIYPPHDSDRDVSVRSWVSDDYAELDIPLAEAVADWLDNVWPFRTVDYRLIIRAAAAAALNPASMFTTVIPGAQELSIVNSGASPLKAAP